MENMLNDPKFFNSYEKITILMKRKSIFYHLPYQEHPNIAHLHDPMHILISVSSSLWRHISLKKCDTMGVMRDANFSILNIGH